MEEFDPGDGDEEYWKTVDFQNYSSKSYESNGKLSWIWRKGVNLGKKMVLTGVVVSSASIVLPPLVALTAIGVAFSVPAGFVFTTYACGNKLLNIILPMPTSTPFEGNGTIYCDEEEYRVYLDDVDKGYEESGDLEVEEKEFEAEMRVELAEEDDGEFNGDEQTFVDMTEVDKSSSEVSEIVEEEYEDNVGDNMTDEEQPLDSKATHDILEGIIEAENEIASMEKEDHGRTRVSEFVEEGYEEDVGEYVADEEQAIDSKAIPEILEVIKEVENDMNLTEKKEDRMLRVIELDGEGNEEDVGEYMAEEEQPLDTNAIYEIPKGVIEEENEFFSMEKEEDGMERVSEIVEEGYEEDDIEYIADEEQPLDSKAFLEMLEEVKEEENEINIMEKEEGSMLRVIELDGEEHEEDVGEYMVDEEQPLDSKAIPVILEPIQEAEDNVSLLEKEKGEMPKDSLREIDVAAQLNGENEMDDMIFVPPRDIKEENEFAGFKDDKLRIETLQLMEDVRDEGIYGQDRITSPLEETAEENDESRIVPVKDMSQDKENKHLTIIEEVELATDDKGVINGLESENNVEQVKEDMASVSPRNLQEENGFAGVEEGSIEEMKDEGKDDQKRKYSPAKGTLEGKEKSEMVSVNDLLQDTGIKNLTTPKEVVPAIDERAVKSENNVKQETENMALSLTMDRKEVNEFVGIEEEELKRETTGLIEKMRDEGKDNEERQDNTAQETPEGKDMSRDRVSKNLTLIPGIEVNNAARQSEPAMDDKGSIVDLNNNLVLGNISNEGDKLESSVEDQLKVNVKVDDDHTVTKVHQRTGSDKRGTSILSKEDTREEAVGSGIDLSNNGTVALAGVEEEKLKRLTMESIEKLRDEGKDGEKQKDNPAKETPEKNEESGRVILKDMSQDKENKSLSFTLTSEGLEPAIHDLRPIVDLKSDVFLGDISNEGDTSKSAVEYQLEGDGDHIVTEVYQGIGSDKRRISVFSEEDIWEDAESGFDVSEIVSSPHIADSFDKLPEGEGQSSSKMVEVNVEYHEVAIEPTTPVPELLGEDQSLNKMVEISSDYHEVANESTMPISEHSETALDQEHTVGSDKVRPNVEKVWEEINAMRTIVGYAYTPHRTCAEELKALYDFTGVELPASSEDPADLADINEKLHFLMSIVGVK